MNFSIGEHQVGGPEVFVIAEVGNNHNGDFDRAVHMIDRVADLGGQCVKFQMRNLSEVYRKRSLERSGDDLSTEYVLDLLDRFELSPEQHRKLFHYCRERNMLYMCTPWDVQSLAALEDLGVLAYKVASADLTNLPLIGHLVQTGKPLILSTGMSRTDEIRSTAAYLRRHDARFALLHCNSTYPAPFHDINLAFLSSLREIHPLVGYSGHERGTAVSLAAVALGAKIIERHFTLDRGMEGPDHAASLEPAGFQALLEGISQLQEAIGQPGERCLSQGELINRENLAKSLVAARPLCSGAVVTLDDVRVRSPGQGLSPQRLDDLVGRTLRRDLAEEDYFFPSDLQDTRIDPRAYRFGRPWGIPVRYHDFGTFNDRVQPDLFEFHFSYSDMDLDPSQFLNGPYDADFVVHAPEMFEGSHLMDLATPDADYRSVSMRETQRIIDITRRLKTFFPKTKRPGIVCNVGGFTMDHPLPNDVIPAYYARFQESLGELDFEGVELWVQTMAPFPWHFGGQRYQNLFVLPDEVAHYCEAFGLRMCLDVSHTKLTCNHHGLDFYDAVRTIAPYTAHLHLGDSAGLNGEGLQVGDGEIDFSVLGAILKDHAPAASFIPEIWQGHKDGGEGFWVALDRLEGTL